MARLLDGIEYPRDMRNLTIDELPQLAREIREEVISVVSEVGGHFASTLGAVELTLALHYVFNTPEDRIVWDTGHQAYAHKLICGRRNRLATIRQWGGLSGFLSVATKANTTPSAPVMPALRFRRRWAWSRPMLSRRRHAKWSR